MLEIVLLILKIAGIILAVVLGILITGLYCVLFVPVRYRGDFSAADGEDGKKKIGAVFRAVWLLRLVRVYVSYEESVRVRIKLLFFTLLDTAEEKKARKKKSKPGKNKEERRKKKRRTKEERSKETVRGDENGESAGGESVQAAGSSKKEAIAAERVKSGEKTERADENPRNSKETEEADGRPKGSASEAKSDLSGREGGSGKSFLSKVRGAIKKRISNILQTIRDFCDKLKRIREKAQKVKELWTADHMISARGLLWKEFLYLLRHSKPRKLEGYLRFGFEDPSVTGYAMAIYGISCSIWRPQLMVEPDFEKQVLECHVRIKGKIRACHFLKTVLVLFFSKDVRHVINDIKEL